MKDGRCIVICAGDFTPVEIKKRDGDFVIAVDGGYLYSKMAEIAPDLIVGDFDSVGAAEVEELSFMKMTDAERIVELNPCKDDTDTLAALRIGLERGYRNFHIYGAMGGRLEHTIANIQCLHFLKNHGAKGYILDAYCMMTLIQNETVEFQKNMEGYLSLFSLNEKAKGVTIKNMKYPLDGAELTNDFPIGISNEFIGKAGEVTVEDGTLLAIIRWTEE